MTDPVCGMTIDRATAAGSATRDGDTYYFCSSSCQQRFDEDPAKFTAPAVMLGVVGQSPQPRAGGRLFGRRHG